MSTLADTIQRMNEAEILNAAADVLARRAREGNVAIEIQVRPDGRVEMRTIDTRGFTASLTRADTDRGAIAEGAQRLGDATPRIY